MYGGGEGGGGLRTLNFHPQRREAEWVQSYYYTGENVSQTVNSVQIEVNWCETCTVGSE